MHSRAQFLKAINAHPDDDTLRPAFADWLQKNGDPARAEFIRVQLELARYANLASPKAQLLKRREAALLKRYRDTWERQDLGDYYPFARASNMGHRPTNVNTGSWYCVTGDSDVVTFRKGFADQAPILVQAGAGQDMEASLNALAKTMAEGTVRSLHCVEEYLSDEALKHTTRPILLPRHLQALASVFKNLHKLDMTGFDPNAERYVLSHPELFSALRYIKIRAFNAANDDLAAQRAQHLMNAYPQTFIDIDRGLLAMHRQHFPQATDMLTRHNLRLRPETDWLYRDNLENALDVAAAELPKASASKLEGYAHLILGKLHYRTSRSGQADETQKGGNRR